MQAYKTLALLLSILFFNQAQAYQFRTFQDHGEIEFRDILDPDIEPVWPEDLNAVVQKPLILYFTSPGGDIDRIRSVAQKIRGIMQAALLNSGTIPTVVVSQECSSACIPVLSAFNQMAAENLVRLLVDRKTVIGFHGCSDVDKLDKTLLHLSVRGTNRYLGYFKDLGGSPDWIEANSDLFRTADITELKPEDRRLQESGILSHAEIVDLSSYRISYQTSFWPGRTQASN